MGKSIRLQPVQQTHGQEMIHALSIGASNQTKYSVVGTSN